MPELFWGGAETQFRLLIEGIDKKAFDLHVLIEHSKRPRSSSDDEFINANSGKVKFHELSNRSGQGKRAKLKLLLDFFSKRKQDSFDLVIIYGGDSFLLIPWLKASGYTICYSDRNAGKTTLRQRIKSFFYRPADIIVCNSKATFDLRARTGKNVEFIPNATKVSQESIHSGYDSNTILLMARIARVKNIECAVQALRYLPDEMTITLVGKAEDQAYEEELRTMVKKLDVTDRFLFKGYSENIAKELEGSFCTILPSREEGMPNAVLESWAHERVSIVSDVPGNTNLIHDPQYVFPCDAPEVLAGRIMDLKARSRDEYNEICAKARLHAKQSYSIPAMIDKYEKMFESAAS